MTSSIASISLPARLDLITRLVSRDEVPLHLLEKLLDSVQHHFFYTVAAETRLGIPRDHSGNPGQDMREELEKQRTITLETLTSDLRIFNDYLRRHFAAAPSGGLFDGPEEAIKDPEAVADWAGAMLMAIYRDRKR
ncbi:DUF3232 domain-containing protein [Geothermobacter hydrogeniphilus]|uniref:Uncharacterized protein n=1 Tax=Geothermobacter hydrogeniphilus TaxID=1969733 RepID=A0A1X0Y571_9BACT|nr:DUF3232 domain-containing protein [Geothermobacter hydrogeniphilus]ORJ60293.1 hypothetical protein B5V00_08560 [Geothermobacter hydrogeniphilus]